MGTGSSLLMWVNYVAAVICALAAIAFLTNSYSRVVQKDDLGPFKMMVFRFMAAILTLLSVIFFLLGR